tara:strand:+ start:359 stop:1054 length:696 start_codon:yes stop_codon:yes gene_type:complete
MKHFFAHYIARQWNVDFSKWVDRPRPGMPGIPKILFRHDFMSMTGHVPWEEYFKLQDSKEFFFVPEMKLQNIVYLFRDPLDVLFSYWPYLQSIPYKNFTCPQHTDIIDFAKNKQWGLDVIINFMNKQLDHFEQHQGRKLLVRYEDLKKQDSEWRKLISFTFKAFKLESFTYAKEQTTFEKMQQKNNADAPSELKFYRKGGSNYIFDLPKDQQDILLNWAGLKDLNKRINEN